MADITIHGIDEDVMERLRVDAEANGRSLEEVALHILTNWHGLVAIQNETLETVRRSGEKAKMRAEEFERLRKQGETLLRRGEPGSRGTKEGAS